MTLQHCRRTVHKIKRLEQQFKALVSISVICLLATVNFTCCLFLARQTLRRLHALLFHCWRNHSVCLASYITIQAATMVALTHIIHLLSELTNVFQALTARYNKSCGQLRKQHMETSEKTKCPAPACHCDPQAIKQHMDDVLETLRSEVRSRSRSQDFALTDAEVIAAGELLRSQSSARLSEIFLELKYYEADSTEAKHGVPPPSTIAPKVFRQLTNTLPSWASTCALGKQEFESQRRVTPSSVSGTEIRPGAVRIHGFCRRRIRQILRGVLCS